MPKTVKAPPRRSAKPARIQPLQCPLSSAGLFMSSALEKLATGAMAGGGLEAFKSGNYTFASWLVGGALFGFGVSYGLKYAAGLCQHLHS